jgi:hypothetical protein
VSLRPRRLTAALLALLVSLACQEVRQAAEPEEEPTGNPALAAARAVAPGPTPSQERPDAAARRRELVPASAVSAAGELAGGRLATAPAAAALGDHRLDYLERSLAQLARLEKGIGALGPQRDGPAALAATALAARGRAPAEEAARYARRVLEECAGRWHGGRCDRASLPLQRLVLQLPGVLPEDLEARLRAGLAVPPAPPAPEQAADPWGFAPTENQRLITLAGALGAHALAGTGDSPAARAWADHAVAVLTARDERGWYEEESAGYLGISVQGLLHLRDLAPAPRVRRLAHRQLDLLFLRFAERQVGGVPAGARTRTYIHWALGRKNIPWPAWAWYLAGVGDPEGIFFGDWPTLALSGYEAPEAVRRLLADRRSLGSYEVRQRRDIVTGRRKTVDGAIYSRVTPDYVLSASQAVQGMSLGVSGGEEIPVVLLPEGPDFAPLYLWSRVQPPRAERWRGRTGQEQSVAHGDVALARLGDPDEPGHVYLAPGWEAPESVGDALVTRYGDTWVALVTDGGWEVARAQQRFAPFYGRDKAHRESRVAVPKRQPAAVALEVARASAAGSWAAWKERAGKLRLEVERKEGGPGAGEPAGLAYGPPGGPAVTFRPGESATVDGRPLDARSWPVHESPFLVHERGSDWRLDRAALEERRRQR